MSILTLLLAGSFLVLVAPNGCGITHPYVSERLRSSIVEKVPEEEIVQTVFLIGDAGAPSLQVPEPTLVALEREASKRPDRSMIIFVGDNVYPNGIPEESDSDRLIAEQRLNVQIGVVERSGASGFFIPGNHDWDLSSEDGWESIKRQADFVVSKNNLRLHFLPEPGSPGPATITQGDFLRVYFLDTQWWLRDVGKRLYPNQHTEAETEAAFVDSLEKLLKMNGDRFTLVVGHHPLDSHGPHGGFFDWKDHLFPLRRLVPWLWIPLPVLGSVYPLSRNLGISDQDASSSRYHHMIENLEKVLSKHPRTIYAAGHEHALQVLKNSGQRLILVSGNGIEDHDSPISTGPNTLFADGHPGFMRVDILRDKRARLSVIEPRNPDGESVEVFSMWIEQQP